MNIKTLTLTNFRSYAKTEVGFGESTIIVGPNAQGKTNLLEGAYLATVGRSFRAREAELVRWGEDYFRIVLEIEGDDDRKKKIEYIYESQVNRKTIKVNGAKKNARDILGASASVFFSPEEVDLFFVFPSARRRYFNLLLSKTARGYSTELVKYSKTLDHRNALLKNISRGIAREEDLEVWDGKLAEHGAKLVKERASALEKMNELIASHYKQIASSSQVARLVYESSFTKDIFGDEEKIWADFTTALLKNRRRDMLYGATTLGPHRDNYVFYLDDRPSSSFASRGESRTLILSLKFAEADYLAAETKMSPVLLLDDVFSELDESRRRYLVENFAGRQVIVTTTDMDHVEKSLRKKAQIYKIAESVLEEIHE